VKVIDFLFPGARSLSMLLWFSACPISRADCCFSHQRDVR
jgi:hypothetical protein